MKEKPYDLLYLRNKDEPFARLYFYHIGGILNLLLVFNPLFQKDIVLWSELHSQNKPSHEEQNRLCLPDYEPLHVKLNLPDCETHQKWQAILFPLCLPLLLLSR